ncbi:glycosyltransferase [Paenibacillus sp. strain BS8-2]
MIRILHIMGSMGVGGAETFIMKLFRKVNSEQVVFDFVLDSSEKFFYENEILELGGRIYRVPLKSEKPIKSFLELIKIVKENHYKAVFRASAHSFSFLDLLAAHLGGANCKVIRSTNSSVGSSKLHTYLHKLGIPYLNLLSSLRLSPSREAAEWMFGKKMGSSNKVIILKNGVDLNLFQFDIVRREKIRKEFDIGTKRVFGHIGRFSEQKNHSYIIDVFYNIYKKNKESVLLLFGEGELENRTREKVRELNLEGNVIFGGIRTDIADILMAMDVLLFPSIYEGMPNVLIEAQATGLKCIVSDSITKEVVITNLIKMLPLQSIDNWVDEAIKTESCTNRQDSTQKLIAEGYDINQVAELLQTYYLKYR